MIILPALLIILTLLYRFKQCVTGMDSVLVLCAVMWAILAAFISVLSKLLELNYQETLIITLPVYGIFFILTLKVLSVDKRREEALAKHVDDLANFK